MSPPPPAITIRDYARNTDFEAIVRLHQDLNRVEADLGAARDTRQEAAVACLHEDTRAIRHSGGEQLVAVIGDEVVGYVALELARFGAFVPPERQAYVHVKNLVVAPKYRRGGVGSLLLARAEELARLHSYRVVTLSLVSGNEIAEAAYSRAGFEQTAIEMTKVLD